MNRHYSMIFVCCVLLLMPSKCRLRPSVLASRINDLPFIADPMQRVKKN